MFVIMFLQMVPWFTVTDGRPTIVLILLPSLVISVYLDWLENYKINEQANAENELPVEVLDQDDHKFVEACWAELKVGQIVKINQNERFPADLILLKSSNLDGTAYVETTALDGESNLKCKTAIRDMQDAILSP